MEMSKKFLLIATTIVVTFMCSCSKQLPDPDPKVETKITPEEATPKNLVYLTVSNAREFSLIKTDIPMVETGGLAPSFEILGAMNAEEQTLNDTYMEYVSIESRGETAGVITIAAGNPFSAGDYYFNIKVTSLLDGKQYSTTFAKGFELNVKPEMPSALSYSPSEQTLEVGRDMKTTGAQVTGGNPDISFSLGSDTDKLVIDPVTGAISIKEGYDPEGIILLTPKIIVTNNISSETMLFENCLTITISSAVIVTPDAGYFFMPTFAENSLTGGYKTYTIQLGLMNAANVWIRRDASAVAAYDRPSELTNNYSLLNNPTVGGKGQPHESWLVMTPQNLAAYKNLFHLTATFWIFNDFVNYLSANGESPCELIIKVSTDYNTDMSTPTEAIWVDVTAKVLSQIYSNDGSTFNEQFYGVPYPGPNGLIVINGSTDNDVAKNKKNPARNANKKWTKCMLDLGEWANSQSFTIAFQHVSNFTGEIVFANALDRMGQFSVSDVYYNAKEK